MVHDVQNTKIFTNVRMQGQVRKSTGLSFSGPVSPSDIWFGLLTSRTKQVALWPFKFRRGKL